MLETIYIKQLQPDRYTCKQMKAKQVQTAPQKMRPLKLLNLELFPSNLLVTSLAGVLVGLPMLAPQVETMGHVRTGVVKQTFGRWRCAANKFGKPPRKTVANSTFVGRLELPFMARHFEFSPDRLQNYLAHLVRSSAPPADVLLFEKSLWKLMRKLRISDMEAMSLSKWTTPKSWNGSYFSTLLGPFGTWLGFDDFLKNIIRFFLYMFSQDE